ncbi:NB-ARC domain-containing protein [Amycolatopsis jiangsuensis]|uniref:Tetratricopeptide (TPR) repeat protein n=1 Tax=Amycolatopsis jiangsuensis TaxID=1181879 RepID=A0A840J2N1_9PSEU|nr:NB-ARC domain-containing protein [Amycolatopsis jiangsuensis]MBB4689296.1 tetratricopeptide (TPR) repeat protein [Amycolatopsis jiangsuensis]
MLRSAPRHFVDRVDECRELVERSRQRPGVFVLQGIGGVGKTAVMLRCARELRPSFDCVLDVSMSASAQAKTVEQVLDVFLLQLEAKLIPPTLDGKIAIFRAETSRRKVLVVLDDVDSAESILELLPESPESVVLATSRLRAEAFEFYGFTTMRLGVLSERHGMELLSHGLDEAVVETDERALAGIARLSGYLPLALTIAGAHLRIRRHERPAVLLRRLESECDLLAQFTVDGDRELEFVYDASYRALAPLEQQLYRRLGVHPGLQFPTWVVPVLLEEADRSFAADTLLALHRWTLVVESGERHEMHSLIHLHARGVANEHEHPADVQEVRRRLAEAYLDYAVARALALSGRRQFGPRFDGRVVPAYEPDDDGHRRAIADLESEAANLRQVVEMASEAGFADLTWQLAEALTNFLFQRSRYADAIAVQTLGLAAAHEVYERTGETRPLIAMHTELGKAYFAAYTHEKAAEQFAEAATRIAGLGDDPDALTMLAKTFVWQGLVHNRMEQYEAAIECFVRSAELVEHPGFPDRLRSREERLLDMNGAPVLAKLGRLTEAVAAGERAVAHFASDTDRHNHAKSLANLGEVLTAAADSRAEAVLRSALALEQKLELVDFEAHTAAILGRLLPPEEGTRLIEHAAGLYEQLADQRAQALRAEIEDTR